MGSRTNISVLSWFISPVPNYDVVRIQCNIRNCYIINMREKKQPLRVRYRLLTKHLLLNWRNGVSDETRRGTRLRGLKSRQPTHLDTGTGRLTATTLAAQRRAAVRRSTSCYRKTLQSTVDLNAIAIFQIGNSEVLIKKHLYHTREIRGDMLLRSGTLSCAVCRKKVWFWRSYCWWVLEDVCFCYSM